ncbi:MAG: transposase [Candidatus Hinthialibacter antarcticus]|nr:transposase [Candidatus Hinthialibacter antarcticus]
MNLKKHDSSLLNPDFKNKVHPVRINEKGHVHFVTTSCCQRKPFFDSFEIRKIVLHSIDHIRNKKEFFVFGYVIMPEHAHFLLAAKQEQPISKIVGALKWYVSINVLKAFREKGVEENKLWQERFYDFNIFTQEKLIEKLTYCHQNPVVRRLVNSPGQWPHSSFRNYEIDDDKVFRVDRWWEYWEA